MAQQRDRGGIGRRGKLLRRGALALVVLVALAVGTDYGAAAYAEYRVSKLLAAQLRVTDDPRVAVRGFPFFTQALSGDYSDITVDADGIPVNTKLRDLELHTELRHVRVPPNELFGGKVSRIPVDRLDGTVRISAPDIGRMLKLPDLRITPAPIRTVLTPDNQQVSDGGRRGGKVDESRHATRAGFRLVATKRIAGQPTKVTVFGLISLVDGEIQAAPRKLRLTNALFSGSVPEPLQSRLLQQFVFRVDPGTLPFEVRPTKVGVEEGAFSVTGRAKHLELSGRQP